MLVVNPAHKDVTEAWLDPEYWGERAKPVSAGGRGSAWFVETSQGEMVLRQYRRGGLVAHLSERSYVFTGWRNTRSLREFELLRTLRDLELPVPEPVAACAQRHGLWYQAAILIRRLPGAVPLPETDRIDDEALWQDVGRTIRRFHDAGLDHVDLNCDNILVTGREVYLIDFDRCWLRAATSTRSGWKQQNLCRLWRSVEKRLERATEQKRLLWGHLMSGYHGV